MPFGSITTKQLLYLVGLQRTEKEQQIAMDYLYQKSKTTLDQLTKEEASESISFLVRFFYKLCLTEF